MQETIIKQLVKDNIADIGKIQIEYRGNDIIIIDTLLDEMYDFLTYTCGYDEQKIRNELANINAKIIPEYDLKLCFFKIRVKNILSDKNYCINELSAELKEVYASVTGKMLNMIDPIKNT